MDAYQQVQLEQARAVLAAAGETPVTKREVTWRLRELFEDSSVGRAGFLPAEESKCAALIVLDHRSEIVRLIGLLPEPAPKEPEPAPANS